MSSRVVSWAALFLLALPGRTAFAEPAAPVEARRLSEGFAAVAEKVSPSVVQIEVTVREPNAQTLRWYKNPSGTAETPVQRGMGSGVVFNSEGAILTNNHVVEDALTITVRLRDGRLLPARLVGRDPATDLALIRVDAKNLVPARFADSDAVRVGEWVVAIGSPFGLGYTVTTGVVSAKGRGGVGVNSVEDYLQTDASINPGNSGGPLVNLDGQVLGINTMIVGRGQGIGFAVPSNLARRTADQLVKTGRVQRAWIGVGIQDVTPELAPELGVLPGAGALVNSVASDGPGARAQLRPADIIAAVDGRKVKDAQEFIRELLAHDVGQTVLLEVVRAGKHYGAKVELVATRITDRAGRACPGTDRIAGARAHHPRSQSGAVDTARHASSRFRRRDASRRRLGGRSCRSSHGRCDHRGGRDDRAERRPGDASQPGRAHASARPPPRRGFLRRDPTLAGC
jgi:serine protease Do